MQDSKKDTDVYSGLLDSEGEGDVFRNLVVIQTPVFPFPGRIDDAFGNIHNLSGVIFQFVGVDHNRKRLPRLHQRGVKVDGKTLLTQECDSHVCRRCRSRMNRGHNRMTGETGFYGRVALE